MAYPPGVPERRRRPRRERTGVGAGLGAVIGGLISGPAGVVVGGMLGHGAETEVPWPLDEALRAAFAAEGTPLVQLYRRGPFTLEALFISHGLYTTLVSSAPRVRGWQQLDLDDWLFGDLVDCQLGPWLRQHPVRFL